MVELTVNLDPIVGLRGLGRSQRPDPVAAVFAAEHAGASGVSISLREDKKQVGERDLRLLKDVVRGHFNVEIEPTQEMLKLMLELRPSSVTLVDVSGDAVKELDIAFDQEKIVNFVVLLREAQIEPRILIAPDLDQLRGAHRAGAVGVEVSTWSYVGAANAQSRSQERQKIIDALKVGQRLHLQLFATGGLDYQNVAPLASIDSLVGVKVGHSIIAKALTHGLERSVAEMVQLLRTS